MKETNELDPDRVESHGEGVILHVKGNRNLIKESYPKYFVTKSFLKKPEVGTYDTSEMASSIGIPVVDSSLNTPKCAKAFRHLIKLYGGRGELF